MQQIDRAERWWSQNRDKAPSAFDDDLASAFALIRENPLIGERVRARGRIRRHWLSRIRYFIYYQALHDDIIEIVALRHGARAPRR